MQPEGGTTCVASRWMRCLIGEVRLGCVASGHGDGTGTEREPRSRISASTGPPSVRNASTAATIPP